MQRNSTQPKELTSSAGKSCDRLTSAQHKCRTGLSKKNSANELEKLPGCAMAARAGLQLGHVYNSSFYRSCMGPIRCARQPDTYLSQWPHNQIISACKPVIYFRMTTAMCTVARSTRLCCQVPETTCKVHPWASCGLL